VEIIVIGVIIALAWGFLSAASRSSSKGSSGALDRSDRRAVNEKQRIYEANEEWLRERWRMADAEKAAGVLQHFPKWYFDETTERQRDRLTREGVSMARSATKGRCSDVIGLFEEPDSEDAEKLKFFGVTLKGALFNQTRARHEIAKLDADPERQRAWLMRPASPFQKEFYRFIGEKPPAGVTYDQAEAKMRDALGSMAEAQQEEWSALESLIDEFEDREFRSDVEIRKPTIADIRAAMGALKAEGGQIDDPYEIAEKLLEMKPALAR
jgi:hypothetical protein